MIKLINKLKEDKAYNKNLITQKKKEKDTTRSIFKYLCKQAYKDLKQGYREYKAS